MDTRIESISQTELSADQPILLDLNGNELTAQPIKIISQPISFSPSTQHTYPPYVSNNGLSPQLGDNKNDSRAVQDNACASTSTLPLNIENAVHVQPSEQITPIAGTDNQLQTSIVGKNLIHMADVVTETPTDRLPPIDNIPKAKRKYIKKASTQTIAANDDLATATIQPKPKRKYTKKNSTQPTIGDENNVASSNNAPGVSSNQPTDKCMRNIQA